MKKSGLFILVLLFSLNSFSKAKDLNLLPVKASAFYLGIENSVRLIGSNVDLKGVVLECDDLVITEAKGTAHFKIQCAGTALTEVKIVVRDKSGKKLGKIKCVFLPVPDPVPSIGGVTSGVVTRKQCSKMKEINVDMVDFPYELKVEVVTYKMFIYFGGDIQEFSSKQGKFYKHIVKNLGAIKYGSKITFEDIIVKMPNGETRKISPLTFTVVK